ncbi:hypothetical protein [Paenibacillus maysiensis]|uniref:hypothetical protein n=1 Tax=Paenibacillus maysiensis TaxID=1155954 RepID=UPI000675BDF7|nr:hypothetical protein [Paenibacillus maysiensis]
MVRPLRERIILPIAVAPGFLDWNKPVKVGIQGQRQTLTLLQNDSVRSATSSTNLHEGAGIGGGAVHNMPHRPKERWKSVFHCFFYRKATFLGGLPNLRSKQPAALPRTRRLKERSLEPPYLCAA